jgi:hypothetical protein
MFSDLASPADLVICQIVDQSVILCSGSNELGDFLAARILDMQLAVQLATTPSKEI